MAKTMMVLLVVLTTGWSGWGARTAGATQARTIMVPAPVRERYAVVAPGQHSLSGTGRSAGVGRRVVSCPSGGQWVGLPYLNRYTDGKCGYTIGVTVITYTLTLKARTVYQEDQVTIGAGGGLILPSGSTLVNTNTTATGVSDLIDSGLFVVQPGAALYLSHGASIRVNGLKAALQMRGTAAHPIIMSSARPHPAPGDWGRIEFDAGTVGQLTDVHLSYAGAAQQVSGNGAYIYRSGILVNGVNPTITHCTIDHGAGNGIEVDSNGTPTMGTDALLDNAGWAVRYDFPPRDLTQLSGLTARGRGTNVVSINPGNYPALSGTWHNPGLPLHIADKPGSRNGALFLGTAGVTLTVVAGVTLQMEAGDSIVVGSGGVRMQGTTDHPIIMTSARPRPDPGSWGRIRVRCRDGRSTHVRASLLRGRRAPIRRQRRVHLSHRHPGLGGSESNHYQLHHRPQR